MFNQFKQDLLLEFQARSGEQPSPDPFANWLIHKFWLSIKDDYERAFEEEYLLYHEAKLREMYEETNYREAC